MLYTPTDPKKHTDELYRKNNCQMCPLKKAKTPDVFPSRKIDVVIITKPMIDKIGDSVTGFPTWHTLNVECHPLSQTTVDRTAKTCCSGRKLELIKLLKPKLVLSVGNETFYEMEDALGMPAGGDKLDYALLPTELDGHVFWHVQIPDFKPPYNAVLDAQALIKKAMALTPEVESSNYFEGVKMIVNTDEIQASFNSLAYDVGWDIETTALRPYSNDSAILSMALSDGERTYGYPLFHPQTPHSFDQVKFLELFYDFMRTHNVVAQNLPFELEWMCHFMGREFAYLGSLGDTMAQAYLLSPNSKSLNALTRQYLGYRLKSLSNIDVVNLRATPINKVLDYNCLDAKATIKTWHKAKLHVQADNQQSIYQMQIDRARAVAVMQVRGLTPNIPYIQKTTVEVLNELQPLNAKFSNLPEVIAYARKYGSCSPMSNKDVKQLHHDFFNVDSSVEHFNEEFLSKQNTPVANILLDIREKNKIYNTYLVPFNVSASHADAGKHILDDGLIHPIFNTMRTSTGRLSSESPNAQNFPARGGGKKYRQVIMAEPGKTFFAIDYGQIEYRLIAALSKDKEMIDAILNGLDIHGWWAKRLDVMFPGLFLKNPGDQKEFDEFRNRCKNGLVFPLCFGSSNKAVGSNMKIKDQVKMEQIGAEFWAKHKRVKQWHNEQHDFYRINGYVENAFGRKYRGNLGHNQIINYPIQGSASELVVIAMAKLVEMSVTMGKPWLAPVMNIHDDLSFIVPDECKEEAMEIIVSTMLDVRPMQFLPIPLTAEVSYGDTWGTLNKLGTFSSLEIYGR